MKKLFDGNIRNVLAGLSLVVLVAVPAPSAQAGNGMLISWSQFGNGKTQTAPVRKDVLKVSPSLPFIPTYTGRNFINTEAIHYAGLPTGECYNTKYLVKEDPSTAHTWYLDALRQCGWRVDDSSAKSCSIIAVRDNGMSCYVYTRPSHKSGFACEVIVRLSIR